jgi:hypothetical protein
VPSKRPPPPKTDLDEVERALSVLGGRHPEHEKTKRETLEAARKRSEVLAAELEDNARRRLRRTIVLAASGVAVAAVAFVAWRLAERTAAIHAGLTRIEAPWSPRGFAEIASNAVTAGLVVEADAPGPACFVAVTEAEGALKVRHGSEAASAAHSVGWCSCGPEHVVVDAPAGASTAGVGLLRADARAVGGPLARGWLDYAPGAWAEGGTECAETTLDDWLADGRGPKTDADLSWLEGSPAWSSLGHAGFRAEAGVPASRPFAVVQAATDTCWLALSKEGHSLSLRMPGGARRASGLGTIGWCASAGTATTVWSEGGSAAAVLSAPSDRIGGLLGLHEASDAAGRPLGSGATWVSEDDFPREATALLRASTLKELGSGALPPVPGTPNARLEAVLIAGGARIGWDPASAVVACDPPLEGGGDAGLLAAFCASASSVSWWRKEGAAAGASATLPVWLAPLEGHHEPDAVARIPELLALARRLVRDGFVPTTLEGVTELPDGVKIVGRAGEDAVVAVGVGQKAPWVFPYTNGVPWDLGDKPVVVEVAPGETVKLTASPPPNSPANQRRTVVFRRTIKR